MSFAPTEGLLANYLRHCRTLKEQEHDEETQEKVKKSLEALRRHILFNGLQEQQAKDVTGTGMTQRGRVWKALLGLIYVSAEEYLQLVEKGKCAQYDKIRSDSFRTFPKDEKFHEKVAENSIIRCLNSFVQENDPEEFRYLQGMNAISGPFLYVLPEVDAYYAFCTFLKKFSPTYWRPEMYGARAGCILLDRVLQILDPEIFDYLRKRSLFATVYGFSAISSFSASIPPFSQLILLWDFFIAFGLHHNVICVAAQILQVRDQLLQSSNPSEILNYRKWPPLQARSTISVALQLVPLLPQTIRDQLSLHTTDMQICKDILNETSH